MHIFTRTVRTVVAAFRRRWSTTRSSVADAGYSVMEWVFISAAGLLIASAIYAAIQSKAMEKIGIINGS